MRPQDCIEILRVDDPVYLTTATRHAVATAIQTLIDENQKLNQDVVVMRDHLDAIRQQARRVDNEITAIKSQDSESI